MPLLIDTYNVLHTTGVLPPDLAISEVSELVTLLHASRYAADRITLACDGSPSPGEDQRPVRKLQNIIIRYSGPGRPADDLIAQLIQASTAPRQLVVVSSDHAVLRSARKRRCKLLTSEEFLQQLADDHRSRSSTTPATSAAKPPGTMSDQQVDRWVQLFDLDDDVLAIAPGVMMRAAPSAGDRGETTPDQAITQDVDAEAPQQTAADIPELKPGEELPPELIEQAERLWAQHNIKPRQADASTHDQHHSEE